MMEVDSRSAVPQLQVPQRWSWKEQQHYKERELEEPIQECNNAASGSRSATSQAPSSKPVTEQDAANDSKISGNPAEDGAVGDSDIIIEEDSEGQYLLIPPSNPYHRARSSATSSTTPVSVSVSPSSASASLAVPSSSLSARRGGGAGGRSLNLVIPSPSPSACWTPSPSLSPFPTSSSMSLSRSMWARNYYSRTYSQAHSPLTPQSGLSQYAFSYSDESLTPGDRDSSPQTPLEMGVSVDADVGLSAGRSRMRDMDGFDAPGTDVTVTVVSCGNDEDEDCPRVLMLDMDVPVGEEEDEDGLPFGSGPIRSHECQWDRRSVAQMQYGEEAAKRPMVVGAGGGKRRSMDSIPLIPLLPPPQSSRPRGLTRELDVPIDCVEVADGTVLG